MHLEAGTGLVLLARRDLQRSLAETVEAPERRRGPVGRHRVVARPQAHPHEGLQPRARRPGEPVHVRERLLEDSASEASPDAIRTETGLEKWSFKTGEDPTIHNQVGFQSSPAVVDGTVYVGCRDAHVYAIDAATGHKKWDYPTSKSWVIGTPAVRDGVVYVGTSDSSRFMALDAKNGRLRFNFDAKAYVFSSAALAGDLAYVGDHNGRLYAIDIKSGKLAWEFQAPGSKADPRKILNSDGSLNQEVLYAPVFGDFEEMYIGIYKFTTIGSIMSSPVVDKGVVYFGSMDGNLYALQ